MEHENSKETGTGNESQSLKADYIRFVDSADVPPI
jgi:hypothetical protein